MIILNTKNLLVAAGLAVIVGGLAFFGGMKFQESRVATTGNRMGQFQRFGQMGASGMGQMRFGGGGVIGEILSMDDKSMTVKLDDGSSKIVLLPDNTIVSKTDTGAKSDLKTGVRVGVFGTSNSDGTVTAQNVQLNPMFRMRAGGMGQVSPSSSPK